VFLAVAHGVGRDEVVNAGEARHLPWCLSIHVNEYNSIAQLFGYGGLTRAEAIYEICHLWAEVVG
jgi:hypothetical protein